MNGEEHGEPIAWTRPHHEHTRWPGWIWAVPIAAVAIVAWLLFHSFITQGPTITITFASVDGMNSNTDVRYKGLKVGEVDDLKLADGGKHVIVTLSMDSDIKDLLRSGTRFWIVGGSPNLQNLSALKDIFAGPHIGMDPGPGRPVRHFSGLESAPQVMSDEKGTVFYLHADRLGQVYSGTQLNYRGTQAGVVEHVALAKNGNGFDVKVFVQAPYDGFVRTTTRFWNQSPLRVTMNGTGLEAHFASLSAITSGAIAFATPERGEGAAHAAAGDRFILYSGKDDADEAPIGKGVRYVVRFDGAVGDLEHGAPVMLRGFKIGRVLDAHLDYDMSQHLLDTPVTIEIDPTKFDLENTAPPPDGNWRPVMDGMMRALIAQGLRARIAHTPPLIGGATVELKIEQGAKAALLAENGSYPEIPASGAAGIDGLAAQASDVMEKINNLPLDKIASDVKATAARVRKIVSSPKIDQSIAHLDRALANIDKETGAARGKIGPLVSNLKQAAASANAAAAAASDALSGTGPGGQSLPQAIEELTRAARSVRELASYLDRHPEAIVKGRSGESK